MRKMKRRLGIVGSDGVVQSPQEESGVQTEAKTNGEGKPNGEGRAEAKVETKKYSVGANIQIGGDDAETIKTAHKEIEKFLLFGGTKADEYDRLRAQVLQAVDKARQDYNSTVTMIGKKRGIALGDPASKEVWNWNPDTLTWSRVE